ncbi:hypothetical protein Gotur_017230 [Gossypium turneri]
MENIEDALSQIRAKLENFDWKDIYNNKDETSIFYVVCYNRDGSDKVPLWVVGKFANPRCFKHVDIDNLNCHY